MDIQRVTFSERKTVQNPLLKYAVEAGWEYVNPEKALEFRDKGEGAETGVFFREILLGKILQLNPWIQEGMDEEILRDLEERTRYNLEGNQKVLNYLRGEVPIFDRKEEMEKNVRLIDYENPQNNIFQVTDELTFTNGKTWNRFDIVFYINGIPILILETKNPEKEEGIAEAINQIQRYHRESPEFVTYPPLFAVSNLHEFKYGPTWNLEERYLYNWRAGEKLEEIAKSFFDPKRILSFLSDYVIFWEERGETKKIVLGFHQIRAIEKIVERVKEGKKKHGLIWHTQGSGKSLSMIVAAHKLRKLPSLENPTILMVVDRTELEEQMTRNLKNYGFPNIEVAESRNHLQELLKEDFRGLIVTTIQKFDRMPERINERNNIIVFVDEAHRTQEGELGVYMRSALPSAFYFGFTGTPIDKTKIGKGTFLTFGFEDAPQGYLDKYSITDSLHDGTTVPIYYTLAPNEFLVPKDILEQEFFKLVEEEAVTSIEELDKKVLDRALRLRNLLKAKSRIEKVAAFVARHFRENVEPLGFKAFLVGVDREACALLKYELDKHLPENYSKVVFTPGHNDDDFLRQFHIDEREEREIKKNFLKANEQPKILIVTSKLLTGFDAPILYAMYLDKPMNDHALLQAIARVNRPLAGKEFNNPKSAGLIIDFVGIFEKLERALRFDSANIEGAIIDLEKVKQEFVKLIERGEKYLEIVGEKIDDKAVERIVDYFSDKARRKEFLVFYKELSLKFEIIAPDTFLRPYLEKYFLLTGILNVIKANIHSSNIPDILIRKTLKFIREKVGVSGIEKTLPIYPIDERTITLISGDNSPERVKIIKLHRSIKILIDEERKKEPFLLLFRERLEKILEEFETRQIETKEALKKFEAIVKEINDAKNEKKRLGLDSEQFAMYWILEDVDKDENQRKKSAQLLTEFFRDYSEWIKNPESSRELRRKIIANLLSKTGSPEKSLEKLYQIFRLASEIYSS